MKIVEVNHKTAANLLKKPVEDFWLEDNDAYIHFMDGSVVCIHMLENSLHTYVSLNNREENNDPRLSLTDEQSIYWFAGGGRDEVTFTSRIVVLDFDCVKYYYHRQFDKVTREYIPVIEFRYYEKGEEIGSND